MDHYATLGVPRTASTEDIKKAFRLLAHKHHPDKGGNEATFKRITAAYAIIGNDKNRAQYDIAFAARTYQGPSEPDKGFAGPKYDFAREAGRVQFDFGAMNEAIRAATEAMRNTAYAGYGAGFRYANGAEVEVQFDPNTRTYVIRPRRHA